VGNGEKSHRYTAGGADLGALVARRLRERWSGLRNQICFLDEVADAGPAKGIQVVVYLPRERPRVSAEEIG